MKSLLFVILFTCFLISLVITDNSHDVDWMSFIHDEVLLHDITIPGTHDTGTKTDSLANLFENSKFKGQRPIKAWN